MRYNYLCLSHSLYIELGGTHMITNDILYLGVNDRDIDLFEGQYIVPEGISYNSYLIMDEKTAVMDTVDQRKKEEYLTNLENALKGRCPDYLVVSHVEPDHASSVAAFLDKYPSAQLVGNAKTFQMLSQFFDLNLENAVTVKEGDVLSLGRHQLHFTMAPMVHWPEAMTRFFSVRMLSGNLALWMQRRTGFAKQEDITLILSANSACLCKLC